MNFFFNARRYSLCFQKSTARLFFSQRLGAELLRSFVVQIAEVTKERMHSLN